MKDLTGKQISLNGCMGCEIVNENLKPFCGILYRNENFVITQDFELPINGFIIISTIRHISKFNELTENEQTDLTKLINKTLTILEENNIAEEYNIVLEEKDCHFHVWLMPRHKWMNEKFSKIIKNIQPIMDYAKQNLRTEDNFNQIKQTCELLKRELNK